MRRTHALALAAAVAAPVAAQVRPNVAAVPDAFTGAHAGHTWVANPQVAFPATLQWWYRGDSVGGPRPITAFGIRAAQGKKTPTAIEVLSVQFENSKLGFNGLSKTWANNLSKNATAFFSGKINWQADNGDDPNKAIVWIPGSRPFAFVGPNLLIHHVAKSFTTSTNQGIDLDAVWQNATPTLHSSFGRACGAQLTASYTKNGRFALAATGALPNRPVTFMLGANSERFGGLPLPIDLGALGMTGCDLHLAPLAFVSATADSGGAATLSFPFTIYNHTAVVKAQTLHPSAKTLRGLATSNATTSLLGSTGLCNSLYALGGSQTAIGGPEVFNAAPVVLIR